MKTFLVTRTYEFVITAMDGRDVPELASRLDNEDADEAYVNFEELKTNETD